MTRVELIDATRGKLDDRALPYKWDDVEIIQALTEGQRKLCEDTGFFLDITEFTITIEADTKDYLLPVDAIIQVNSVWIGDHKLENWAWSTKKATGYIHFHAQYEVGTVMDLHVWRYPLIDLDHKTNNAYDANPELPKDLHMGIVYCAANLLFINPDQEKGSMAKASDFELEYRKYVAKGKVLFQRKHNTNINCDPCRTYVV